MIDPMKCADKIKRNTTCFNWTPLFTFSVIAAMLTLISPVAAQVASPFDPYGMNAGNGSAYGSNGGSQGYGSSFGGSGYGTQGGAGGYDQSGGGGYDQSGSMGGLGGSYNPGGGNFQYSGGGSGFSPTNIPSNQSYQFGLEYPLESVTGVPQQGSMRAPLYARPGDIPGQFELLQKPAPEKSEFQKFVENKLGKPLPRFGETLILNGSKGFVTPSTAIVPPDYILNPGDQIHVGATGSVEADLTLLIDSEGKIFIPRIGEVNLAGVRYGDLADAIKKRFNDQYKNVNVSAVIARLHGITVYVTGYAVTPGAYTVSSLSTMANAVLASGGPASGGSYRVIYLHRNGKTVSTLDLYQLLIDGDKTHDAVLQNQDVLEIRPTGPELAITGSVNNPAIFEAKSDETLEDIIRYAGGLNSLADRSRIIVSSLADLDVAGSQELSEAQAEHALARGGDIVRVLSLADVVRPQERQAILATIDGEVDHPGRYFLPAGATLGDLIRAAGGETSGAFVYGAELDRISVQRQQRMNYDRVIDDLRLQAATEPLSQQSTSALATDRTARTSQVSQGLLSLIDELKKQEPNGRVVLPISYSSPSLPTNIPIENLDHIYIPPVPKSVGVFGSVYEVGSFLYVPNSRIGDYLNQAGGPRNKVSDGGSIFVIRANGSVISISRYRGLLHEKAQPGDVIFVPVRTGESVFERALQISQLAFQSGLGLATIALSFAAFGVHL